MFFTVAISTIGSFLGAYIIYVVTLHRLQDRLIFYPAKADLLNYRKLDKFSEKLLTTSGFTLQGWTIQVEHTVRKRPYHLLYFGGNAQEASAILPLLDGFGFDLITTFNYRGYGLSDGNPCEKSLYSDALEIYDWVGIKYPESNIIVMGHSLGSAIAGHVARFRNPEKIILSTPLYSLERIAKERFFVPGSIVKHKFSLFESTKEMDSKVLALTAKGDAVIPNSHSYNTLDNIVNIISAVEIPDVDHNSLIYSDAAKKAIRNFLSI